MLPEGGNRPGKLSDGKSWQGGKEGVMLESLQQAGGGVGRELGSIRADFLAGVLAGFRICRAGFFVCPSSMPSELGSSRYVASQPCR